MKYLLRLLSLLLVSLVVISTILLANQTKSHAQSQSTPNFTVIKNGNAFTMKAISSTGSQVWINFNSKTTSNLLFSWTSTQILPPSSTNIIVYDGDDITPIMISGNYVGGGHGFNAKLKVPAVGHNKTQADLGSVWLCNGLEYTLIGFDGTTNLIFAAAYTETDGFVTINTDLGNLTGDDMHYVRGGDEGNHTDNIDITNTSSLSQLYPSVNHVSVKVYLDGSEMTGNGTFTGNELKVCEQYDIVSYKKMIEYAQSHAGDCSDESIEGDARMNNTYTFTKGLNCVVESTVTALRKFFCTHYGVVQAVPVGLNASYTKRFVPNLKPITITNTTNGELKVLDFVSGVNLTEFASYFPASSSGLYFTSADFSTPGIPPNHSVDWAYDAQGNRLYGFAMGYLIDQAGTTNSERVASLTSFWRISVAKKNYPRAIENTVFNIGDTKSFVAFRNYLLPGLMPDATAISTVHYGDAVYIYLDYNNSVYERAIEMDEYIGKAVAVVQSENFQLLTSTVGEDGIVFNITGNQGNAILKIDLHEPVLEAVSGSGCTVDYTGRKISGYDHQQQNLEDCFQVPEGYVIDFIPADNGGGTGSFIRVLLSGEVVESYHILLYGDVNGDNNVDSSDAGIIIDVENFQIQWDMQNDDYLYQAADVNGDDNVDSSDAGILIDVENFILLLDKKTGQINPS